MTSTLLTNSSLSGQNMLKMSGHFVTKYKTFQGLCVNKYVCKYINCDCNDNNCTQTCVNFDIKRYDLWSKE